MKRRGKYKNIIVHDPKWGIFRSKIQHTRWHELLQQQKAGLISHLEKEKRFLIIDAEIIGGKKCRKAYWVPDAYFLENTHEIVEDTKSSYTLKGKLLEAYRRGRALFKIKYPHIEVREYVVK